MRTTSKIVLGAISTFMFIVAAGLLAATIALGWLYGTQRGADGYVTSDVVDVSTDGYAIISADIDMESMPEEWIPSGVVGTFRVQAESEGDSPLFIGVGPSLDVADYLADVEHAEVTRFGSQDSVSYTDHAGSAAPAAPASLEFWTVASEGNGAQTLDWEPESGAWTMVIMNSDAAPGVEISTSVGVDTPWIPIGIVIIGVMTLLTAVGAVVLAVITSRMTTEATSVDPTTQHAAPLSN